MLLIGRHRSPGVCSDDCLRAIGIAFPEDDKPGRFVRVIKFWMNGLWAQRLFHFLNATRALQGKVLLLMRVSPLARVDATTDWAFLEHTMKQLRSG